MVRIRIRFVPVFSIVAALAVLAVAGCGSGSSTPDSKIADALGLEQKGGAYEMAGNPFCTVVQLLNDSGEVSSASDETGHQFAISGPKGKLGIVVRKPFAPSCERQAKDGLRKLERKAG
jgi:hypothetical protein